MTRAMSRTWAVAACIGGLDVLAVGVLASTQEVGVGPVAVIWNAPCPAACGGPTQTRPLDTDNASYACCKGGHCVTCSACPWLLRLWC
jgi:hypothetical protein